MQIQPQFQTLGNLLAGRLFHIPEYQRAYSWQTKQREDLFRDIQNVHSAANDSTHFMATIVGLRRSKRKIAADEYI
ncbi:MAG: GmrSD restriction endonuclease domain-containing protein, partial [Candidatus Acidiferrales bacterium]